MTYSVSGFFSEDMDPQYKQGITHLQAGEWQDAITCFETVLRKNPGNEAAREALEEARFKAGLDDSTDVRAKQWIISWRSIAVRVALVVVLIVFAVQGGRFISGKVAPLIAQAREERAQAQLLAEANAFLEAGKLDSAEARYTELLAAVPDHAEAQAGLERVAQERELLTLYGRGVAAQERGDYQGALAAFTDISTQAPKYRDVSQRITAIQKQQELDQLYADAQAAQEADDFGEAVAKYEQIRNLSVTYQANAVETRLFNLYFALGRQALDRRPPAAEHVQEALEYFTSALTLRPRNAETLQEQRLAKRFVDGQQLYYDGRWTEAVTKLRQVYDERPNYLGGMVVTMLYDAYIKSGDQYRDGDDLYLAHEQYLRASELPVSDTALAEGRMLAVKPFLTPTPTPTITPTPRPTAIPTQALPGAIQQLLATPTPTPTPVPLQSLRGKIVFFSDNPEQPGLWVMDPSGNNREYLGGSGAMRSQYDALIEQEKLSPDGGHRAFVGSEDNGNEQIFIMPPSTEQFPDPQPQQLTYMTHTTYDPAWSPDGDHIAYVSQSRGSDDIWVTDAWLVNTPSEFFPTLLTNNEWEWDKHPTWSPDSDRIAFWSNRAMRKQIYVMNADGSNVINISNTDWDEYDPLWIK